MMAHPCDMAMRESPDRVRPLLDRWMVAATVAGNALEFYDFLAYATFAVYIGQAFFPADSALASLLLTLATFGVGFFTRPLGGLLIGAFADRAGRRPALMLTISLMTVGTLGVVLTPSYTSIGVTAPIILIVARLVQGLALGGEVGPSTAVLLECAPPGRRGMFVSWQNASQGVAVCAAGLVGLALSTLLSKAQLASWGWRVPFALGLRGLDYAIRVVDPSWKPPKRASRPRGPFRLPKGKITVETLRTLKERPGLSAPELAEIVAARCALKLVTKTEREDFTSSVGMALRRFERRGVLEIIEKNARTGALHWRIRPALNKPLFRSAGLNEKLSGVEA